MAIINQNAEKWRQKESRKLRPGDRIELRVVTGLRIDDDGDDEATVRWVPATIVEIIEPAGEYVRARVRYDDGQEQDESLARIWRHRCQ